MDDPRLYLALDQGGHASRAIVFDAAGNNVVSVEQPISTQRSGVDRVEHVAYDVTASIRSVLDRATAVLGPARAARISAVGLATQRSSIVCWDRRSGMPLSPVISWQDTRGAAALSRLMPRRRWVHETTGMFPSAHYGASKLAWCVDNIRAVRQAAENGELACGPLVSFLAVQLCGPQAALVDPANAGRTLLWNLDAGDWDDTLLEEFSMQRGWLPRCVNTIGDFGGVAMVPGSPPLRAINGDQSAALFAAGIPGSNAAFLNVGTGAFIQHPRVVRPRGIERLPVSVAMRDGERVVYAVEGTVNGAGSALEFVAKAEGLANWQEGAAQWLNEETSPPVFVNGVGGLGSPFWVPALESRFVGAGNGPARWVAALESIVFLVRTNLDELRRSAPQLERLVVSGGVAVMDEFCQRVADLCAITVVRPVDKEATARGIACLLRPNCRWETSPAVRADDVFLPRENRALAQRYAVWREEMRAVVDSVE